PAVRKPSAPTRAGATPCHEVTSMKVLRAREDSTYPTCGANALIADPIDSDRVRLRSEFLTMPALCLTVEQVARLLSLPVSAASRIVAGFVQEGFLTRSPSGRYRLADGIRR